MSEDQIDRVIDAVMARGDRDRAGHGAAESLRQAVRVLTIERDPPLARRSCRDEHRRAHDAWRTRTQREEPHYRPENKAKVRANLLRIAEQVGTGRLLDLGCGAGFVIDLLADALRRDPWHRSDDGDARPGRHEQRQHHAPRRGGRGAPVRGRQLRSRHRLLGAPSPRRSSARARRGRQGVAPGRSPLRRPRAEPRLLARDRSRSSERTATPRRARRDRRAGGRAQFSTSRTTSTSASRSRPRRSGPPSTSSPSSEASTPTSSSATRGPRVLESCDSDIRVVPRPGRPDPRRVAGRCAAPSNAHLRRLLPLTAPLFKYLRFEADQVRTSQAASDHEADPRVLAAIRERGFAVVPGMLDADEVANDEARACSAPSRRTWPPGRARTIPMPGWCTTSWFAHPVFARFLENPVLHAYLTPLLGDTCILYAYTSSSMPPSGANFSHRVHVDSPRVIPGYWTNVGVMVALDDYTDRERSDAVPPASFERVDAAARSRSSWSRARRRLPKAGDAVVFNARTWHMGGMNRPSSHAMRSR